HPDRRGGDRDRAASGKFPARLPWRRRSRRWRPAGSPLPIAVGLEDVFFRVLPIVLSLAFSTMFNSTTFSSSRRKLQRANPTGAGEQVRAINFASAAPSKIRGRAEFGLYLRVSAAAIPSSTSRRRVRPILLMLVSNAAESALSLQPSPASDTSAFSRMRAFVSDCAGCLPAQIIASSRSRSSALNLTTYFLTEISLPATNHLHRRIAATEIQKNTTDSMTLATRACRHSIEGEEGGDEVDRSGEAGVGPVVAGGDTAELFDPLAEVLDQMPPSIHLGVVRDGRFAVGLCRNDRDGASFVEDGAQGVVVEGLVGDERVKIDARYERLDADAVVTLARQQDKARQ